jgi:hypothetical protein
MGSDGFRVVFRVIFRVIFARAAPSRATVATATRMHWHLQHVIACPWAEQHPPHWLRWPAFRVIGRIWAWLGFFHPVHPTSSRPSGPSPPRPPKRSRSSHGAAQARDARGFRVVRAGAGRKVWHQWGIRVAGLFRLRAGYRTCRRAGPNAWRLIHSSRVELWFLSS